MVRDLSFRLYLVDFWLIYFAMILVNKSGDLYANRWSVMHRHVALLQGKHNIKPLPSIYIQCHYSRNWVTSWAAILGWHISKIVVKIVLSNLKKKTLIDFSGKRNEKTLYETWIQYNTEINKFRNIDPRIHNWAKSYACYILRGIISERS